MTDRVVFASPRLAADIDGAEGRLCAGLACVDAPDASPDRVVLTVGGGVAVYGGAGSPANKMVGIGFAGAPDAPALDAVETFFAGHGVPLQAEVSTLAAPETHATLARRGYEPRGFENVLGCAIADVHPPSLAGVDIDVVAPRDRERFVDMQVEAWTSLDAGGVGGDAIPPSDELRRWMRRMMGLEHYVCIAARIEGQLAGGAALRVDGPIAQFCGAATLPQFRRRGVQTALLRWRLAHARTLGGTIAIVTTQPASKSQENVQREGFQLLYARQLLVKMPSS